MNKVSKISLSKVLLLWQLGCFNLDTTKLIPLFKVF